MIGEQLRTLRTANKMTQKELAGELSVAFQTISNWENNSIDPSVSMILRIAEYFNCSTDYLLKGDDSSAKYIDTTQLTEHQHAQLLGLAKEFSKLNKKYNVHITDTGYHNIVAIPCFLFVLFQIVICISYRLMPPSTLMT